MAYRSLEVTLISAKDLKKVAFFSKMAVYAEISISGGDSRSRKRTIADREGGRSPTWNIRLRFPVPATGDPATDRLALRVLLRSRHFLGDRDVGEVYIPFRELLDPSPAVEEPRFVSYQIRRLKSGNPKGVLSLYYKVLEIAAPPSSRLSDPNGADPVTAYPAAYPPPSAKQYDHVTAYPAAYRPPGSYQPAAHYPSYPPPHPYGYGAPPPAGYGYGAPSKGQFGMGLGAGLLGGLLLGDMIGDAAAYDAGYDGGFGDGGGF
ncbi:protein SRC2-like [Typha latifolia]|uniref:protein SRC2-like n=1 Tax=Typha latifolia TaxID=4733 RepID=UPI003C3063F6